MHLLMWTAALGMKTALAGGCAQWASDCQACIEHGCRYCLPRSVLNSGRRLQMTWPTDAPTPVEDIGKYFEPGRSWVVPRPGSAPALNPVVDEAPEVVKSPGHGEPSRGGVVVGGRSDLDTETPSQRAPSDEYSPPPINSHKGSTGPSWGGIEDAAPSKGKPSVVPAVEEPPPEKMPGSCWAVGKVPQKEESCWFRVPDVASGVSCYDLRRGLLEPAYLAALAGAMARVVPPADAEEQRRYRQTLWESEWGWLDMRYALPEAPKGGWRRPFLIVLGIVIVMAALLTLWKCGILGLFRRALHGTKDDVGLYTTQATLYGQTPRNGDASPWGSMWGGHGTLDAQGRVAGEAVVHGMEHAQGANFGGSPAYPPGQPSNATIPNSHIQNDIGNIRAHLTGPAPTHVVAHPPEPGVNERTRELLEHLNRPEQFSFGAEFTLAGESQLGLSLGGDVGGETGGGAPLMGDPPHERQPNHEPTGAHPILDDRLDVSEMGEIEAFATTELTAPIGATDVSCQVGVTEATDLGGATGASDQVVATDGSHPVNSTAMSNASEIAPAAPGDARQGATPTSRQCMTATNSSMLWPTDATALTETQKSGTQPGAPWDEPDGLNAWSMRHPMGRPHGNGSQANSTMQTSITYTDVSFGETYNANTERTEGVARIGQRALKDLASAIWRGL